MHRVIEVPVFVLFVCFAQARTDDWVRPARILKALHLTQEPAHQFDPAALQYLRARTVAHGAAVDIESAVDLHQTFPELSSSCVGHLLPEGLVFALSSLYVLSP